MILGMPFSVLLPWFIALGGMIVCWWLGIVYWGKELKTSGDIDN